MDQNSTIQIDTLFDRAAKPASRITRRSRIRTTLTLLLLIILLALIGGYAFVTDPQRVRAISESYLTELTGGPVTVDRATLSIFEGLKLDGIRITVDDSGRPDALLMEARSLHISYSPGALLTGKIKATRILALEPRVYLVENTDTGLWNFQRLSRPQPPADFKPAPSEDRPSPLPEVLVRNARVEYAQIAREQSSSVGSLSIEGQLTPDVDNTYHFRLQSRGGTSGVFPIAEGWLTPGGQRLGVVLRDVEFVDEIKTILPAVVRRFWEEHRLAGRIGETRVSYYRRESGKPGFTVATDLDGVRMIVPAGKYLGPKEHARIDRWRNTYTRLASPALGNSPVARMLINAMQPGSLELDEVDGTFVFTDESIDIKSLVARMENNRFKLSGQLAGYDANSPFKLRVESLKSENLVIPEAPTYIKALPWPVQEIYYRYKPKGAASFWLEVTRKTAGVATQLAGEVNLHQASFAFERFPYPIDRAEGKFRFSTDPETHDDVLEIVSVTGHGYKGGPNENAVISVSGTVTPLDELAGSDIVVRGLGLVSDPLLIETMPRRTRETVQRFDPEGTGKLPQFKGDFECIIHCPRGTSRDWNISTLLKIESATGKLATFAYPLRDVVAQLVVHDEFIEVQKADMKHPDGGTVSLTGKVDWRRRVAGTQEPLIQTDLKLVARNMPIDGDLLDALPETKRKWIGEIGLTGRLDIDGKIIPEHPDSDEPTADLSVKLRGGAATVGSGKIKLTEIAADATIAGSKATISNVRALRGDARIEGKASFDYTDEANPQAIANVSVRGLAVDESLIKSLPDKSQEAIKSLKPDGTVDLDIEYAAGGYRLVLRPKSLAVTAPAIGLELKNVQGELTLLRDRVALKDVTANLGKATLWTSGTIEPNTGITELALAAKDLKITPELMAAMPESVRSALGKSDLGGTIAFEFSKLNVGESKDNKPRPVEFAGTVWLADAAVKAGVPLTEINGVITASGRASGGKLTELSGDATLESLKLAGRPVNKLTAKLIKPADQDLIQIAKIDGRIAGGQIGGQIDSILSGKDPRFGLSLVLRNASVSEITGEMEKPIDGQLTASLSLEGRWDDPASRRGRGDVQVDGKAMYRVPILFGLMQIANLTLPLDTPIQQAGLRYAVEGNRVTFDAIDLRSKTSAMSGTGWLDFATKEVRMTLMLGNSPADAVPIFGDLIKGARQDLLQIRVRGSLTEPKVGASAFNTITTTVDEVLRGDK